MALAQFTATPLIFRVYSAKAGKEGVSFSPPVKAGGNLKAEGNL
jgi:hypothetical protein